MVGHIHKKRYTRFSVHLTAIVLEELLKFWFYAQPQTIRFTVMLVFILGIMLFILKMFVCFENIVKWSFGGRDILKTKFIYAKTQKLKL